MAGANMPNADGGPDVPSGGGFWQRIKPALVRAEGEYSFLKGLTVLSVFGTLIGAYFQNLSAYENKVAAQAQADLTAATQTFAEASSALAAPLQSAEAAHCRLPQRHRRGHRRRS
jgi:hypothetical protein